MWDDSGADSILPIKDDIDAWSGLTVARDGGSGFIYILTL